MIVTHPAEEGAQIQHDEYHRDPRPRIETIEEALQMFARRIGQAVFASECRAALATGNQVEVTIKIKPVPSGIAARLTADAIQRDQIFYLKALR